jgi:AraC-like DNA-binding protein
MKKSSIAATFVHQIVEGASAQGLDCMPILQRHGISPLSLQRSLEDTANQSVPNGQEARIPLDNFARASVEIMTALDDEYLGLCSKPQRLGSFNMMARACISARTIKRSLRRCARYWNLFENTFEHNVLISSGRLYYQIDLRPDQSALNAYAWEAILSTTHRFHCWLAGQFIPLKAVSLPYPRSKHREETQRLFYGAQINYDQPTAMIEMDGRFTNVEIVQNSDTLDTYLAGSNLSLLYQPKNYRVIGDQVRQWLEKNLRQGNYHCTLKQAAEHLRISQQVLHRRLQSESTSFKEVKMQTRRDIAINMLSQGRHRVEEIATLVGFSEPSAFIRAFKSWTGETPLMYKQKASSGDRD